MAFGRIGKILRLFCAVALLFICGLAAAREHHGSVTFNGGPVPGATVTATQGDKKFVAVTDDQGLYSFPDLPDGTWSIEIEMQGFSTLKTQVVIGPNAPPAPPWELKMLLLDQLNAVAKVENTPAPSAPAAPAPEAKNNQTKPPDKNQPATPPAQTDQAKTAQNSAPDATKPAEETDQRASDGFLINGSSNNGAASPFAQLAAFGNSRNNGRSLYNGGIGLTYGNSALNASPYSLSGITEPKPNTNQITGVANFGGPFKIPHVLTFKRPLTFVVGYIWTRNGNDTTVPGIVPTLAEREGIFPETIINPATGLPFLNNTVPISPQAQALLNLYPKPNLVGSSIYNYQAPIVNNTHVDALNVRLSKSLNTKDSLNGTFSFQDVRSSSPNLFNFLDTNDTLGINTNTNWIHRYSLHFIQTVGYRYNISMTQATPFWENRENISGEAGITGNNQDPTNWGPPTLQFLQTGVSSLSDGIAARNRFPTSSVSYNMLWLHRNHSIQFGGDFRRQEFNYLTQSDPRGIFQFTGAATSGTYNGAPVSGSDFADFLLGIPDISQIAFGNADKYFRQSVYDAYIDDDWRVNSTLTVHLGVRWDYGAPITELFGRLVNLDVTSGFTAEAPVLGTNPVGSLTGQNYPTSLVRPDKHGIQPRVSFAWRPLSGSSMVVRGSYGIYYDTSVYKNIALLMAQQAPLSTSLNVSNTAACPLTLANGFVPCSSVTPDSFAIDPNFRVGYVQTWTLSVQRDLPGSLVMTVSYLGNKGTRGPQEFLPNTYPAGATNPCPTCPTGFAFLTSNGNSTREAGTLQLRRRLHNGLTATLNYTYSKSIDDDAAMGGQLTSNPILAQNWLDLNGERGLSTFDQRHLLNVTLQYTTGMGIGGKTLMSGWRGRIYKEWTFYNVINVGTGLPETPYIPGAIAGTGFSASLRPELTGMPIYAGTAAGYYLNSDAYALPPAGQFGNAGRDSITGPPVFNYSASLARTFQLNDRLNLDVRFDSLNPINHVTFSNYYTTFGNPLFGSPATANGMRTITSTMRLRF